ncbi:MAG: tyrosine-type recombinase/integrase [Pseudomonadota bacterium]
MGEVIALYVDYKSDKVKGVATLASNAAALARFWGDLPCDAVKKSTCARYERERAKPRRDDNGVVRTAGRSVVRRELGVLQAALRHASRDGVLIYAPEVTLPPEAEPRDRWLTRSEAAKLIRSSDKHIRRFILLSLYTGRRMSAVLELTWTRVDLDSGVIRFRAEGEAETKKRRGSVRIPRQLCAHLRRWRRADRHGETHVVHFHGGAISSVKKAITRSVQRAGLEGRVSAHTLKHTSITWAISKGLGVEAAAEYFDTSPATIRKTYWHHSPYHQAEGVAAMEKRG